MTEKDLALHKGLMKLLDEGTFPLRAKEVMAFAEVYSWAKGMPARAQAPAAAAPKKAKHG